MANRRTLLIACAAALGLASVSAVVAQSVEGVDLDAARARAQARSAEAAALAEEVVRRGAAVRAEAEATVTQGQQALSRIDAKALPRGPAGVIDFDTLVADAASGMRGERGDAPQFIVFVSLSMPETVLRQIIRDTTRAGGVVAFRGFPGNSAKAFVAGLGRVVGDRADLANIGIDPRLFRAFAVDAVPAFVAVSTDFDLCDGLTCRTTPPPHDRMTGNVTVEYALTSFAEGRGAGAAVAGVALRNLRKPQ